MSPSTMWCFGVKAVDHDGNESLVAPYVAMSRSKLEIEAEPASTAHQRESDYQECFSALVPCPKGR